MNSKQKLTSYSRGSGCGCKIAPADLESILSQSGAAAHFDNLLIGNESKDDAAVVDWGDGSALISTTDFFQPIVDDPYDFGYIAAVNAIFTKVAIASPSLSAGRTASDNPAGTGTGLSDRPTCSPPVRN